MILISHRGNIDGPTPTRENSKEYITEALKRGFSVEVDVWYLKNELYLGHDTPEYKINIDFLKNDKIWCHCKNIDAVAFLIQNNVHCFFHQTDDATLTSRGYIWIYPGKKLVDNSVCVMPELGYTGDLQSCTAICSDYIQKYSTIGETK
tara:strand:+ start:7467 stop:7913 length:447 start_codon:yes stop_codon:yes gene_type:complete